MTNNFHNLPKDWEVKTLGEIAEISSGGTPSRSNKDYWENGTIAWVKIADMKDKYLTNTAEKITQLGLKNSSAKIFYKGTLLYSVFATLGRTCILDIEATTNQAIAGINPKDSNINTLYLMYFLQSIEKLVCNMGRGATQNNINLSILKQIKIPLPPLETQKAIVEKLENAFAHIDEAVRHLKAVQTNIPRLKSSLLHCAFSGKLTESQNSSHKVQTLKSVVGVEGEFEREEGATSPFKPLHPLIKEEIPQGWEIKTLGEVFKVIGGGTPSTANPKFWSGNIAWITSANIENENFTIIPKKFINQSAIQASATNLVPKNTIIVVTRVGLGKVGITDVETCFSQDSQALLPLIDLNVKFMAFQIRNKAQNFIVSSRGTTINGITKDTLKKVALKIPPLATQNQIVQILESKFAHLEKLEQFVNASLENLQKLKSSLLNQAFKGELIC